MLPLFLLSCAATDYNSGASEPIQVQGATFFEGELPVDNGASEPLVIYVSSVGYLVSQGQANIGYKGLASTEAFSIGIAFPEVGSGYWSLPVGGPDVTQDNNLLFSASVDFTRDVPYGLTSLNFVAFDEGGNPGPQYDTTLCVIPDFADNNYAACDPSLPPQHTILSLSWDTEVDLDLVVVTPTGKVVRSQSPSTEDDTEQDSIGELSRDSNSECRIDSIRLESLIFEEEPPAGEYQVYASLFSACGEPSVQFDLSLFQRVEESDGTWSTERTDLTSGFLLAEHADGGESLGTLITTISLP